jgi:hypothetical protein
MRTALAWDDTGHQVVAAIAWSQMDKAAQDKFLLLFPDDLQSKQQIVFVRAPRAGTKQDPYPHVAYNHITIANWMDDIRSNSYDSPTAAWHYIDLPFFDGVTPKLVVPKTVNVREKIIENIDILEKVRNFDHADKDHADDKATAAYALAVLMHLVGDVHQPLHCINRYTVGFDEGDAGGNGFPIHHPEATKLHWFWDEAGGLFDFVKLGRDFDENQQRQLADFTNRVMLRWNPEQHPEWKNYSPDAWVEEGYEIGRTQVYQGIKPNGVPDAAYTEKTKQISAERIGMAGYRLAAVLNQIFDQP